jgi:hypothetical protein
VAYLVVPAVERDLALARLLHRWGRDPQALKLLDDILVDHPGEFRALAEKHKILGTELTSVPPPAPPGPAPQPSAPVSAPAPAAAETAAAKDRSDTALRPIREGVASRTVAALLAAHPGPVTEGFSKALGPLLPEEQVHIIVEKLKEANPKFLGRGKYRLEAGKLTELVLLGVTITDLTPLAALPDLRYLEIGADFDSGIGRFVKSPLSDLKPLRGLPLKRLKFPGTSVRDLSPLEGMPLETLRMDQTPVSDLSPLRGMKLTLLDIALTQVSDLSPLQGMPLEHLTIAGTRVTDLSPLRDMPLKELYMRNLKATDYTPIRNCPLRILRFEFVADRDSALVRSMKSVTEKTLVDINEDSPADFIKRFVHSWDKVFDATSADRVDLQPKDGWVLGKNGLVSKGKDCYLVTKDEFEDGDLRVRWHSDGLDYISIAARRSAEKGYYTARPDPAQVNTPPGGKVQIHELVFTCKEDQVKAVLDGQPIVLKDNNGPRRGPLEIHVSGTGHFVLLSIDRR